MTICDCQYCRFGALRVLTTGAIWPLGRTAAVNAAQVREFERALEATPCA